MALLRSAAMPEAKLLVGFFLKKKSCISVP